MSLYGSMVDATNTSDFKLLECGLDMLVKQDTYLLENNVNERAITHKLAEKYNFLYSDFDVDCEYNRNLTITKGIEIDSRTILKVMSEYMEKENNKLRDALQGEDIEDIESVRHEIRESLKKPKYENDENGDPMFHKLKLGGKGVMMKIIPDIIIHERGSHNKNHIVIEAKKSSNPSKGAKEYDLIKLASLVHSEEYKYKMGVFINLPVKHEFSDSVKFISKPTRYQNVFEYAFK